VQEWPVFAHGKTFLPWKHLENLICPFFFDVKTLFELIHILLRSFWGRISVALHPFTTDWQ